MSGFKKSSIASAKMAAMLGFLDGMGINLSMAQQNGRSRDKLPQYVQNELIAKAQARRELKARKKARSQKCAMI